MTPWVPVNVESAAKRLKSALEAHSPLSQRATFSVDRITHEGIVLVVEKPGTTADLSSDVRYSITDVQNGRLGEQRGATVAFFRKTNARAFNPGYKVYVTGIKVGDDPGSLILLLVDMYQAEKGGSTREARYKSVVRFEFNKDPLPSMPPTQVEAVISQVVGTEAQYAARNTKTLSLGQTIAQVKAILGVPNWVVNLGPKVICLYKDMKVIFRNGRVSDVEPEDGPKLQGVREIEGSWQRNQMSSQLAVNECAV